MTEDLPKPAPEIKGAMPLFSIEATQNLGVVPSSGERGRGTDVFGGDVPLRVTVNR